MELLAAFAFGVLLTLAPSAALAYGAYRYTTQLRDYYSEAVGQLLKATLEEKAGLLEDYTAAIQLAYRKQSSRRLSDDDFLNN